MRSEKVFCGDEVLLGQLRRAQLSQFIACTKSLVYCPGKTCSAMLHTERSGLLKWNARPVRRLCVKCVSEFQMGPNPPHGPTLCIPVADWKKRVDLLRTILEHAFSGSE